MITLRGAVDFRPGIQLMQDYSVEALQRSPQVLAATAAINRRPTPHRPSTARAWPGV